MADWKAYKLKDLTVKIGSGATPTGGGNAYKMEGIPLIRSQNVLDLGFSYNGLAFIDDEQADGLRNVVVQENDVLLNITGDSVARACKVPKDVIPARVNQHVAIIRPDKSKLDNDFLLYYLQAIKEYLLVIAEIGATRNALTKGMIENLDFIIPDLPEQQAIAKILSSLDDKIDLLHRQSKTLEILAETLFRQCFVEEVKESWERKSLDKIANYLNGLALQKYPVNGGESLPVIKIRELNQGITENTDKCSREVPEQYVIQDGDILFSWSGSLQIVIWHDGEGALNQHLFKVTSEIYPKWFYYLATKHHLEEFRAIAESKSTTMGHIQRHHLSEAFISIPPEELFSQYDQSISPLIEKLITNNAQIKTLTKQRNTLLPKLMSGDEIRVKF